MYDTYARYIYEWLTETFFNSFKENYTVMNSILERIDNILMILQYGLYLGIFAFLFWIAFVIVRPHFFKT